MAPNVLADACAIEFYGVCVAELSRRLVFAAERVPETQRFAVIDTCSEMFALTGSQNVVDIANHLVDLCEYSGFSLITIVEEWCLEDCSFFIG